MKKIFIISLVILLAGFFMEVHAQYGMDFVKAANGFQIDSGSACLGGEIHDDGTFEAGLGWLNIVTEARFVLKFTPSVYPWQYNKLCLALCRLAASPPNMTFSIVVYDTSAIGRPGLNLIYHLDSLHADNLPVFPLSQFYSFSNLNIPPLYSGSYYIGIRWSPAQSGSQQYTATDLDCPYWPGFYWTNFQPYWTATDSGFAGFYRCFGYRAEGSSLIGIRQNSNSIPAEFHLFQNYPNPFNPSTMISFDLSEDSKVRLIIYDVLGRQLTELVNSDIKAGSYQYEWNADNYPGGVYFYKLETKYFAQTKKLVLLK